VSLAVVVPAEGGPTPSAGVAMALYSRADERAVLGACLFDPAALDRLPETLGPEDFWLTAHRQIFAAMRALRAEGQPVGILPLGDRLEHDGVLEQAGGHRLLAELGNAALGSAGAAYHGRRVHDLARLRAASGLATQMAAALSDAAQEHGARLRAVRHLLDAEEARGWAPPAARSLRTLGQDWLHRVSAVDRAGPLPLGFSGLDQLLGGGLRPGELAVVGARTGIGKSTFCLSIAQRATVPVVIFALEMDADAVTERWLAAEANEPLRVVRDPDLASPAYERLRQAVDRMSGRPVIIDDTAALSAETLRARARATAATVGAGLVVVDYLQLIRGDRREGRVQEVGSVTRALKATARELRVPVIAACQLNRQVESRGGDDGPRLADLRESGSIEQDADVVLLLDRRMDDRSGETRVHLAKNRMGPTGRLSLHFDPVRVVFTEPRPAAMASWREGS